MDMLQIYVVFSLKTIVYVQYFNKNGHLVKTCPFLSWNGVLIGKIGHIDHLSPEIIHFFKPLEAIFFDGRLFLKLKINRLLWNILRKY